MKLALLEAEFSDNQSDAEVTKSTIVSKSIADLRTWREYCLAIEAQLSLIRRLVHGQIDILEAKSLEDGAEAGTILRSVPGLLTEARLPSRRRVARGVEIQEPDNGLAEELLMAGDGKDLSSILSLPLDERLEVIAQLWTLEARVSTLRRTMQSIVDAIQSEVGLRYRNGDVTFPAGALA